VPGAAIAIDADGCATSTRGKADIGDVRRGRWWTASCTRSRTGARPAPPQVVRCRHLGVRSAAPRHPPRTVPGGKR
jgi:hypothetical protein